MQVAFIDTNKYNLDLLLLDPDINIDTASLTDQLLTHYKKMLKQLFNTGNGTWDPNMVFSLYSNIQLNLNNDSIVFTMNMDSSQYARARVSKYVVVTEGSFTNEHAYDVTNTWYVCNVLRIERVDTNSYKVYTIIDKVRTYPQYQRVYKLYDTYNGPVEITADMPSLTYPQRTQKYFTELTDYVAVGVWIGDFYANQYSGTPRNAKYCGISSGTLNNQTTTNAPSGSIQFNKQVYTSSYLTVFTEMDHEDEESTLITNSSNMATILANTTIYKSLASLGRAITTFNAIGTSDSNIAKNLIAAYLVPKALISTSAYSALFIDSSRSGATYTTYVGERLLRGQPLVQSVWAGWTRFGYVCRLQSINLTDTNTYGLPLKRYLQAICSSTYGSTDYYGKAYVKAILDTYQTQYELTPENIDSLGEWLRLVPMFNGSTLNYYVTFGNYVEATSAFTETNKNIKIVGKTFLQIPLETLGVDAYFASEYKIDNVKMIGGIFGGMAGAAVGAAAAIGGAMSGNVGGVVGGSAMIVSGASTTVSSIAAHEYKKFQEQSQNPEMSGVSNVFVSLFDGLFKITPYVAEPDIVPLITNDVNYYGINAEKIYDNVLELNFGRNTDTNVERDVFVYHKGGGVFSTPELKDIFEQGVFVYCCSDYDPDATFASKIAQLTYMGKSTT